MISRYFETWGILKRLPCLTQRQILPASPRLPPPFISFHKHFQTNLVFLQVNLRLNSKLLSTWKAREEQPAPAEAAEAGIVAQCRAWKVHKDTAWVRIILTNSMKCKGFFGFCKWKVRRLEWCAGILFYRRLMWQLPCPPSLLSMRKLMVVRRLKWPKGKSESDILDIFETFCFLKQCLLVSSFFPMCHCSISRSKATSHDTSRMSRCWFWNNQAAQPVPSKIHL